MIMSRRHRSVTACVSFLLKPGVECADVPPVPPKEYVVESRQLPKLPQEDSPPPDTGLEQKAFPRATIEDASGDASNPDPQSGREPPPANVLPYRNLFCLEPPVPTRSDSQPGAPDCRVPLRAPGRC